MTRNVRRGARVVAIAMQKGGVGKSTTAIHLARGGHLAGLRVLVIDLDPQANATTALATERPADDDVSIADVLNPDKKYGNVPLERIIMPSIWPNVELAPSIPIPLQNVERALVSMSIGGQSRLRKALAPVKADYDLILIDCPPSLGLLTINALVAADGVFGVTEAEMFALDGLALLRDTVAVAQDEYNPDLKWDGVLINRWRSSTTGKNRDILDEIESAFTEGEVFSYKVPLWSGISDAIAAQVGLDEWPGTKFRILAEQYKQWALLLSEK